MIVQSHNYGSGHITQGCDTHRKQEGGNSGLVIPLSGLQGNINMTQGKQTSCRAHSHSEGYGLGLRKSDIGVVCIFSLTEDKK